MDTNSSAVSKSSMYQVDDDETSTSEDNEDVETVKTATTAETDEGATPPQPTVVHRNVGDDSSLGEDDDDIDQYFNDLFPDRNRLDTVEEVTEPMSSFHESLPMDLDLAKMSSSGQPSSDFMQESLPPDMNVSAKNSMTLSITSREELNCVSEVEVFASTWPPTKEETIELSKEGSSDPPKAESLADESEENSLSISLPSEGSQKSSLKHQLSEVRAGILKIFDDAEGNNNAFNSFDNVIFNEKHEFEKTEKMISSKASGAAKVKKSASLAWSSEDQPDGLTTPPADNDSGIDGAQSRSSSSKDKVWTKIHKQLNRRFGGSTGSLSSTSPVSEREAKSKVALVETEGLNPEGMKGHIKELLAQLALAEEEKEKIAKEAFNKAMEIKQEADKRLEDAHVCQMKQANLIERLKEKVVDYKGQCKTMENRLLEVNQLANRSQLQLNETTDVIKTLEERLKTTEDRHFAEVKALQSTIEQHQENNAKLTNVNATLKRQLDNSLEANESLKTDLQRLNQQWEQFNKDYSANTSELKDISQCNSSQEKVAGLWREILDFRRQMTHIKMSTERDLMSMKSELTSTGRKVASACVDVWANSSNQEDHVIKLEKHKLERKSLEQKLENLHREVASFKAKNFSLEEALKEEKTHVIRITEKYDKLNKIYNEQEGELHRLQEVARQKGDVERSLQDIAQLIDEDVDKTEDEVDLSIIQESPLSQRRASFPNRRRTRSASPIVGDRTVASVQATLHKKQLQVHELRSRVANYAGKMKDLQKAARSKDDFLDNIVHELEKEKSESDGLKIKLEEATRQLVSLKERVEVSNADNSSMQRSREKIQTDLTSIIKEKSILEETHNRIVQELKTARSDVERLESTNKILTKESKERLNLISQLENVASSLREELILTKEELKKTNASYQKSETTKTEVVYVDSDAEERFISIKKREEELEAAVAQLEKAQSVLKANNTRLDETVKKLTEERLKLTLEVNELKTNCSSIKDQVAAQDRKLVQAHSEKNTLEEQLKTNESTREILEADLRKAANQREELDNQLTSLTLQKDALCDEVVHLRAEADELKNHLDRISLMNASMNKDKTELSIRGESMIKELERLQRQVSSLTNEKSRLMAEYDDIQHDLNDAESEAGKLKLTNEELEAQIESLSKELKLSKLAMNEEIARAELEKSNLEEERDNIKESLDKALKKLKLELAEAENEAVKQKEELQNALQGQYKEKLDKLTKEKEENLHKLQLELDETISTLDSAKRSHREEILLMENAKQQALAMAHQDVKNVSDKLQDALESAEESNKELERYRRDANARLEKDRTSINELQMEVTKLNHLLIDKENHIVNEKKILDEKLNKEKQERNLIESEMNLLKSSLKLSSDKEAQISNELRDAKTKLEELHESKSQTVLKLRESEAKLDDTKAQMQRLEQIKSNLDITVKELELEKENLAADYEQQKMKLNQLENGLYEAKREINAQNSRMISVQDENEDLEEQVQYWQRRHDDLQNEHHELTIQFEKIKVQMQASEEAKTVENQEIYSLRMSVSELESTKKVLEKELTSLKLAMSNDHENLQNNVAMLNKTIEEIRARERKLEDQRHNLEICLSNSQQEVKDLRVQLNGQDGRAAEIFATVAKLESAKRDLEAKISNVASLLHHVRSSSNSRSRPTTPNNRSSSSKRRASSPYPPSSSSSSEFEIDFEKMKADIRDLVGRISQALKDRDEAFHQSASLKRQTSDLLENNVTLEEQLSAHKKKSRSFEEQLKKLELKVAHSDANLADQEEKLEQRETELRQLSARLETTKSQLEALRRVKDNEDGTENVHALRRNYEKERRLLQNEVKDWETHYAQLESVKQGLERDNQRLHGTVNDKEHEIQQLRGKCENLGRGVSNLEDKCNNLSVTVDNLNVQLEKSLKNESDLHDKVADLSQTLNRKDSHGHETEEKLIKLERSLEKLKIEKDVLNDQFEASQGSLQESKRRIMTLEKDLEDTETALHKSESKVNQLELNIQVSKTSLENSGADNYMRQELTKLRRSNENLQDSIKDMTRKMSRLESDKKDLEKKLSHKTQISSNISADHVRSQIPLMGGRSPSGHHAHGESLVKVRLLEQENERLLRKIRSLEQQLTELEMLHGKRVQELLQDRRKEREKESHRQKDVFRQLEVSQSAREKIFKERIQSLEQQVDHFKSQLSKEMRRRQTFIMESSGIANEISELRHNLDQSLSVVNATTDGRTLDREADRLNHSVQSFGPDYVSRLTPSKLGSTSTPKYRRHLHFEKDEI